MKANLYPLQYRLTACLQCGRPTAEHRRYTDADIQDSKGATFTNPVNGYRSPLSPIIIGQWIGHQPMPWPEAQDNRSLALQVL